MMGKEYKFKLALIGDYGSGKTSLYRRWVEGKFSESESASDDCDFSELDVKIGDDICHISLWDTAGMEEHASIEGSYFRGLHGFFLVYTVKTWQSFERIEYWRDQIDMYAVDGVKLVLVGNQNDCTKKERVVEEYEGKKLSAKLKIPFFETSAKTGTNVREALEALCRQVMESNIPGIVIRDTSVTPASSGSGGKKKSSTVKVDSSNTTAKKENCC